MIKGVARKYFEGKSCIFCDNYGLYRLSDKRVKCKHCKKKYSLRQLKRNMLVLYYFYLEISKKIIWVKDKHKMINLESQNQKAAQLYSFLLILVHATTKEKIPLVKIATKKKGIIPSDYAMLKTSQKRVKIPIICSHTKS